MLVTRYNFSFDKLYLTKDSEYGTHVLYFDIYYDIDKNKDYEIIVNSWFAEENFFKLINNIIEEINIQIIKEDEK